MSKSIKTLTDFDLVNSFQEVTARAGMYSRPENLHARQIELRDELLERLDRKDKNAAPATPLHAPSCHPLHVLIRELRYGRAAMDQSFLLKLADKLEACGLGTKTLPEVAVELQEELDDPSNWWKVN